jgi:hypothetical protein
MQGQSVVQSTVIRFVKKVMEHLVPCPCQVGRQIGAGGSFLVMTIEAAAIA